MTKVLDSYTEKEKKEAIDQLRYLTTVFGIVGILELLAEIFKTGNQYESDDCEQMKRHRSERRMIQAQLLSLAAKIYCIFN